MTATVRISETTNTEVVRQYVARVGGIISYVTVDVITKFLFRLCSTLVLFLFRSMQTKQLFLERVQGSQKTMPTIAR